MSNAGQPRKILFVLPTLAAGGAERVLITFMNGADRNAYDPVFLSVSDEGPLGGLIDPSIPVHCLHKASVPRALVSLYRNIKTLQPDIIVSTMAHMNYALLMLRPFFPHTKFIVREAITPSYFFGKYKKYSFLIRFFYRYLYPKADIVLSPTQKVFDEFRALGINDEKFAVIRNPVDIKKARRAISLDHLEDEMNNAVRYVCCGRLNYQKGFDRLIETLAHNKLPFDWRLDIIGDGPEHDNLKALIRKHGFQNKIQLHGFQSEPCAFFSAADCFLLPSRFEGLPNVVLEALACGTPVIATSESGGIDEIEKDTNKGDLTIARDMQDFLETMKMVKSQNKNEITKSLLPRNYEKDQVISDFYALVDGVFK